MRWLLCTTDATSTTTIEVCSPPSSTESRRLSIAEILDTCCNLVVFDDGMDTFRFAHLSFREYLETLPGFTSSEANKMVVERLFGSLSFTSPALQNRHFRFWYVYYQRLENDHRRTVFQRCVKSWMFDGGEASSSFQAWIPTVRSKMFDSHDWDPSYSYIGRETNKSSPLDLACSFGFFEIIEH